MAFCTRELSANEKPVKRGAAPGLLFSIVVPGSLSYVGTCMWVTRKQYVHVGSRSNRLRKHGRLLFLSQNVSHNRPI
jgi:hypothetical protein